MCVLGSKWLNGKDITGFFHGTGSAAGDIGVNNAQHDNCGSLPSELLPQEHLLWRQAVSHSADAQAMSIHHAESCKD